MLQAAARGFTACAPKSVSNNIAQEPSKGRPVEMSDDLNYLIGEILYLNYSSVGAKEGDDSNNDVDRYSSASRNKLATNMNKRRRAQEGADTTTAAAMYSLHFMNTINSDNSNDNKEGLLAKLGLSYHPLDSSFVNPSPPIAPLSTTSSTSSFPTSSYPYPSSTAAHPSSSSSNLLSESASFPLGPSIKGEDPGMRASFQPSFNMINGLPVVQLLLVDAGE
jgi:hypothetical protein